jgi:putative cardiolipin synthase
MHNKSFTADNQVTIIGGRNVGDEYFGAGQGPLFVDLDVLAIGPVVNEVSTDFDRYWASASSYPAGSVLAPASSTGLAHLTDSVEHLERDRAAVAYVEALARQPFVRDLLSRTLDFEWAATKMVSDDPAKGLGRAASGGLLTERLPQAIGAPTSELELVSPYFVPGSDGVDAFAAMAGRGVKVTVLTNSLEATDVAAVHAGYAKRRKPLLEAGVKLFEMKREVSSTSTRTRGLTGSSGSSLHAKTFSVDRSRVFVGSFNFDPRSERLNTEMGFVIDSPELAQRIADSFANEIPERSYEVRLSASRELQWVERSDGGEIVHEVEPGTTFLERAMVAALSVLPIDWLL